MKKSKGIKGIVAGTSIALLIVVAVPAGLVVYALLTAEPTVLRWWAGIATLTTILGTIGGFIAGGYGARERVSGIDLALDKLEKAASSMIDLRGQSAAVVRSATTVKEQPLIDPTRVVITQARSLEQGDRQVVEL